MDLFIVNSAIFFIGFGIVSYILCNFKSCEKRNAGGFRRVEKPSMNIKKSMTGEEDFSAKTRLAF